MQPRVILVTGASSGIGALVAQRLAAAGCIVVAASRRGSAPPGCAGLAMDVDRDESVETAIAGLIGRHGRVDAAILCAGWGLAGAVEDTPVDEALAQFQTNFFGAHRVCRALLPSMRAAGGARIVLVSSLVASLPVPYQAMYCASKAALTSYGEALRLELHPFDVKVTTVEPGNFRTGFTGARRRASGWTATSAHASRSEASVNWMEQDEVRAPEPVAVAARIQRLLDEPHPPGKVLVAANAIERCAPLLRSLLPARAYEAVALRLFRVL